VGGGVKGKFLNMKISLVGYNFELIFFLSLINVGKLRYTIFGFSMYFFVLHISSSQLVVLKVNISS